MNDSITPIMERLPGNVVEAKGAGVLPKAMIKPALAAQFSVPSHNVGTHCSGGRDTQPADGGTDLGANGNDAKISRMVNDTKR